MKDNATNATLDQAVAQTPAGQTIAQPGDVVVGPELLKTLGERFVGVRFSVGRLGIERTLTKKQKAQAARPFGAEGDMLRAARKLFDTKKWRSYQAVVNVLGRARRYWESQTRQYVEQGIRLLPRGSEGDFEFVMDEFRGELAKAVAVFDSDWDRVLAQAERTLGSLFDRRLYPNTVRDAFSITTYTTEVVAPPYLGTSNPAEYQRQVRVRLGLLEESIKMARDEFRQKFSEMVGAMTEALTPDPLTGKCNRFWDSSIEKVRTFISDFRRLSLGDDRVMEQLISKAEQALNGQTPDSIRDDAQVQQNVREAFATATKTLQGMMSAKPRRALLDDDDDTNAATAA